MLRLAYYFPSYASPVYLTDVVDIQLNYYRIIVLNGQVANMLWDYIVISHQFSEQGPARQPLVVEAGENPIEDPSFVWNSSSKLMGGSYDWNVITFPQISLNNRSGPTGRGDGMGGGKGTT